MYLVRYLLFGKGVIGWGVPKQSCTFWDKILTPNSPFTDHTLFLGIFLLNFAIGSMAKKRTLQRSISKSLLNIRRCISFFFCLCNVSKYCFLFVWKANKVKVGEKVVLMNGFHLGILESALNQLPECSTMTINLQVKTYSRNEIKLSDYCSLDFEYMTFVKVEKFPWVIDNNFINYRPYSRFKKSWSLNCDFVCIATVFLDIYCMSLV